MLFKMNSKRFVIIMTLLVLEVLFISLALRSYVNKYIFQKAEYVMDQDDFITSDVNYKLADDSACINEEGIRNDVEIDYNEEDNKITMKVGGSSHCQFYFQEK